MVDYKIQSYLVDCLDHVGKNSGALSVLKPLIFSEEEKLPEAVQEWKTDIHSLELSEQKMKNLMDLLTYAILQRFPTLGRKELDQMLNLTPLEETTAVKEIIQLSEDKGRDEGLTAGLDKGELIGKIHMVQILTRKSLTPREKLVEQSINELNAILEMLEFELSRIEAGSA